MKSILYLSLTAEISLTTRDQSGVMYNFGRVCLSVDLSVCQTITFASFDVESLFSHIRYISSEYGPSSYMKVIGSRSQEQKSRKSLFPQCTTSIGIRFYTVFRKKVIYLFLPYISHSFWANFTKLSVNIRK